jgi:hypothetical protein
MLDLAMSAHWLELQFPEGISGRIGMMALLGGRPVHRAFDRTDIATVLGWVDQLDKQGAQGIYVRQTSVAPNLEQGRRGGSDDSVELFGMWSDLDICGPNHKPLPDGSLPLPPDTASAIRIATESRLPEPSRWILSGGGLYAHWLLDAPLDITEKDARAGAARMSEAWQAALAESAAKLGWHYGTGVSDLARVLRLPGTANRKVVDEPKLCRLLELEGPRYTIDELRQYIPAATIIAAPARTAAAPAARAARKSKPTTDEATSPFDDFEVKTGWSEILVGWTLDERRSRGVTRYWCRPGKEVRDGHSATTGHADDRDRMYCFSDSAGLPQNTPMTKGFVYAQLHHGGDLRVAAKALRERGFGSAEWQYDDDDLEFKPESTDVLPPWVADVPDYTDNPIDLDGVHRVFARWLGSEYDLQALDAVLACAAVEQLDGDPVWCLIVSGPGNAKTETVTSLAGAGALITSTISSEGALLSATSKRETSKGATGGLLRKIGDRGLLVIKDFTSILSMNRDMRAAVLAALREVYDSRWERNVGTDGGRSLEWEGRIVLIGAVTSALDSAHSVISAMGDRFVLIRMDSGDAQIRRVSGWQALRNVGQEQLMRREIREAAGRLLTNIDPTVTALTEQERRAVFNVADLVTRARTAVEHDHVGNPDWAHDQEMPTRFAKCLSQIVRGALAIGVPRDEALRLAIRVGRDSMPPVRMAVLADVAANSGTTTTDSARRLQRPRQSVDRALQELQLLGLLEVTVRPDLVGAGWLWRTAPWVDLTVLGCPTAGSTRPAPPPDGGDEVVALVPAPPFQDSCACPNGVHGEHRMDCEKGDVR